MNISIAMASFNGESFIREQLDSLSCQTKLPHELVICDDGSTDNTLDIVQDWALEAPFSVHIHKNPKRLGHEDNFWKAANLCTGDVIAFCDQDDVWAKNKIERCVSAFNQPEVLLVMHAAKLVDSNLQPLGIRLPNIARSRLANPLDVNPWDSAPGFALVFSRTLLYTGDWKNRPEDHLGLGRQMGHDHWVFFMASILGRIAFLSDQLSLYRRHANNTTSPINRSPKSFLRLAMNTGAETYNKLQFLSKERASHLDYLALSADDISKRYLNGSHYYTRLAGNLTLRTYAHSIDANPIRRLSCVFNLLMRRAYRPKDNGGFGARAFLKDILFSFVRRK